jgi:hypothetical protein
MPPKAKFCAECGAKRKEAPIVPPIPLNQVKQEVHSESTTDTASHVREEPREEPEPVASAEDALLGKVVDKIRSAKGMRRSAVMTLALEEDAKAWVSGKGITSMKEVKSKFVELAEHLGLAPDEESCLREAFKVGASDSGQLTLNEVAKELCLTSEEFRAHLAVVSRLEGEPPVTVVLNYCQEHSLLLNAGQCKRVFEILHDKVKSTGNSPYGVRSQLVLGLHCYCVEPYTLWEDDGAKSDLWMSMSYNGYKPWAYGLCQNLNKQLCTDSFRPVTKREENLRTDCSGIRFAFEILKQTGERSRAIKSIVKPKFHGIHGDKF